MSPPILVKVGINTVPMTLKSGLLIKAEQSFIIHFPIFNAQKVNCIDPNLQI